MSSGKQEALKELFSDEYVTVICLIQGESITPQIILQMSFTEITGCCMSEMNFLPLLWLYSDFLKK